ncbi:hypothetical protein ACLK1T_15945 [Escherichia coli]
MLKKPSILIHQLIRTGQSVRTGNLRYIIPDVLVRKHNGHWTVRLQQ